MKKLTIEELKKIAELKGGKCLSESYENIYQKLVFQCCKNHTWEATANDIKNNNHWCPKCSGKARVLINDLKILAESRNGKCLSDQCLGNKSKLKWQCENGHIWEATPNNVMRGSWCPECTSYYNEERCRFILQQLLNKRFTKTRKPLDNKFELDGYNKEFNLAFEYHGIQHYEFIKHYHKTIEHFKKRQIADEEKEALCELKNIKLIIIPYYKSNTEDTLISFIKESLINSNIIFDQDKKIDLSKFYKNTSKILEMHEFAEKKHGKCLSNTYNNGKTKYIWSCSKGHQWEASYDEIKNRNRWCPYCAGTKKLTLNDILATVKEKGGECLSTEYINVDTKYLWKCSEGHQWEASYSSIRRGTWCPHCKKVSRKTIEDMKILAQKHDGKCLSDKYINSYTKLIWECQNGHTWESKPSDIQQGHWCPKCCTNEKLALVDLKNIAAKKSGKCLSTDYKNSHTPYLWRCDKGHEWKATYNSIRNGSWCPYCNGNIKKTIQDMQRLAKNHNGKCLSDAYINSQTKLT